MKRSTDVVCLFQKKEVEKLKVCSSATLLKMYNKPQSESQEYINKKKILCPISDSIQMLSQALRPKMFKLCMMNEFCI